jgi:pyridoxal phosphate enzyme (YggS family)
MIEKNLKIIQEQINKTCKIYHRKTDDVKIIAVSKTIASEKIIEAINCGCSVFGENYVQEASDKWTDLKLKFPDISLHLIGNLQSNKVKQALNIFDYIQTLDREKLAIALSKELIKCKAQTKFFIQVNIGEESQKSGIEISQVDDFVKYCINDLKLKIEGLMAIPPASDFASPYFALLKKIANRNHLKKLSMGMSSDYQQAIALGSSHIRIGTAIFGDRK